MFSFAFFSFEKSSTLKENNLPKGASATQYICKMSIVLRKPVFGIFDQVRHKSGSTVIEDD